MLLLGVLQISIHEIQNLLRGEGKTINDRETKAGVDWVQKKLPRFDQCHQSRTIKW